MMRKALYVSLMLSLILTCTIHPQNVFEKTYGGLFYQAGNSGQQTQDGGYVVTGLTDSPSSGGQSDVYLIKTDSEGDSIWAKSYGGNQRDVGLSVRQTQDGGYIIAGITDSFGEHRKLYVIKTDSLGDSLWAKTLGERMDDVLCGVCIRETSDDGYIIVGSTESPAKNMYDVYLIKTDSTGDSLWTKRIGGNDNDWGCSIIQSKDDSYVIVGTTMSFGNGLGDVYMIKTDSSGDTLWTRTYGGPSFESGGSIQVTYPDFGFIVGGLSESFGAGFSDAYIIKTDSTGDSLWARAYGGRGWDAIGSAQQTFPDNGYIFSGLTESFGTGDYDVYLIKTDSSGDTLWTRTYGGPYFDSGPSIQQTEDGGYIIAGTSEFADSTNEADVYLIKTDSFGHVGINTNDPIETNIPKTFSLSQNYPNPFNPSTTIAFDIPGTPDNKQPVSLTIYDLRGRRVRELLNSDFEPGTHKVHWDGKNDRGESVASGIYLYRLKAGDETCTRKMMVLE
jgi:hypothetical protein